MNFFAEFIKFLGSPTRGKWPTLITLLVATIIFLVVYERYTATFRLGRLQKETDLIARIQEIETRGANNLSPELSQLKAVLLTNAVRTIQEKPFSLEFVPSKLTFSFDSLWKFLCGSSVWLFLALLMLPKIKARSNRDVFKGVLVVGLITGVAGLFVPTIWWPWFHIFIFPWLFLIVCVVVLTPVAILFTNYQKAKKRALANTCLNNLRRINAAKYQWQLEHSKALDDIPTEEDLKVYLSRSIMPKCPCGGTYVINSVKTPSICSIKGHQTPPTF